MRTASQLENENIEMQQSTTRHFDWLINFIFVFPDSNYISTLLDVPIGSLKHSVNHTSHDTVRILACLVSFLATSKQDFI